MAAQSLVNRRVTRRELLKGALAVGLGSSALPSVLAGCVMPAPAAPGAQPAAQPAAEEKREIVYWAHTFPPAVKYVTEVLIPEWEEKHPNLPIVYETVPHSDFEKKLLTALAAGTGPDMYQTWDPNMPLYIGNKRAAPVVPEAFGVSSVKEVLDLYMPGSLDAFVVEGNLYGIPLEYNTLSLWIRSDAYREVGLDPNQPPTNWTMAGEYGAKLVKRDENGAMLRSGWHWPWKSNIWYMITYVPILRQAGGDILNAEGTQCIINEQPGVDALQIYADMVYKYKADDPAFAIENDFAMGRYTQQISGIYFKPYVEQANPELKYGEHFQVVQLPQIEGGKKSTMLYAWCWTVNPASKMQKESWEWINFMSQHGEGWFANVGYIQPRKGWLESEVAKANPALPVFLKDFEYGQYLPRTTKYQEIESLLGQAIERSCIEGMPPKESLDIMKGEVDKLLAG